MNMRRNIALTVLAALLLSSCSISEETESVSKEKIKYDIQNARLFDCDNDSLYVVKESYSEESSTAEVEIYSENGEKTGSVRIDGIDTSSLLCWDVKDGTIYFVAEDFDRLDKYVSFYSADVSSGAVKKLFRSGNLDAVSKLAVSGDNVYWLGRDNDLKKEIEQYIPEDMGSNVFLPYVEYRGELFGYYDLKNGKNHESGIDFPIAFDERNEMILVYAYDSEGGYHFINLADEQKTYTDKFESLSDFQLINDNGDFGFINHSSLFFSNADDESGIIEYSQNVWASTPNCLAAEGDCLYIKTPEEQMSFDNYIYRFPVEDISTSESPIKMISSYYVPEPPFGCGYQINAEQLSQDGFALKVLSLDKDYDIAIIRTDAVYADNIRKNGSFYPLGQVEGVREYLDKCFPYIKEAAEDESKEIWMLPIEVEIPVIVYNKENCTEAGVTFENDISEFVYMLEKVSDQTEYYSCSRYCFIQNAFFNYLRSNSSFDTAEFRRIAPIVKDRCTTELMKADYNLYSSVLVAQLGSFLGYVDAEAQKIADNFMFTLINYASEQRELLRDTDLLRAAALPNGNSEKVPARCTFLVVNPYSENLEKVLEYIEKLSVHLSEKDNSFMLSDEKTYTDNQYAVSLLNIYKNGEICFEIPDEVYYDSFENYCADSITLDEFIAEADRKLAAYLNE